MTPHSVDRLTLHERLIGFRCKILLQNDVIIIHIHWFNVPTSGIRDVRIPENHFTLHSIVSK
jgi:hypothetical protein